MKKIRKLLSCILVFTFFVNLMPTTLLADTLSLEDGLKISADLDGTINIEATETITEEDGGGEGEEEILPNIYGVLEITADMQTINRDYSQSCEVIVKNNSSTPYKYYMVSDNKYDDLAMNFVKECSIEKPLIIYPNEEQKIELSVFAQNAELLEYKIPICAYIVDSENSKLESRKTITIKCKDTKFDISCNLNSTDDATLTKTFTLINNGDKITDITLSADDSLKDYVIFNPIVENYEMDTNDKVDFTIRPDLTKMSKENLQKLSGQIIIKSGSKSKNVDIIFDTEGQEITTTTMGELSLIQEENLILI